MIKATDLEDIIEEYKKLITNHISSLLSKMEPVSLYEPMRYVHKAGGKRLRPILTLLSCEAVGGEVNDAVAAAVALELVHNFTLVHDDIMDNDDLRRGRETVHKKWDESVAILVGDGLLNLAFLVIAESKSPNIRQIIQTFSHGILQVCEGQALDKEFESRDSITLDEYYDMIQKKTGKLFSVACEIGAIVGGGDRIQIESARDFGASLGRAFQIQDDLLDVYADESVLGKNIGSDIEENKKTFLVSYSLQNSTPEIKKSLLNILKKNTVHPDDVLQVVQIFKKTGALDEAQKVITASLLKSEKALQRIPSNDAKTYLQQLIRRVGLRNF